MLQIYFFSAPNTRLRRYPQRSFYLRFQPSAFRSLSRGPGRPLRTLDSDPLIFCHFNTHLHKLIFLSVQNRLAGRQWGAGKPPAQRTFPLSCTLPRQSRLAPHVIATDNRVLFFFFFFFFLGGVVADCYREFVPSHPKNDRTLLFSFSHSSTAVTFFLSCLRQDVMHSL